MVIIFFIRFVEIWSKILVLGNLLKCMIIKMNYSVKISVVKYMLFFYKKGKILWEYLR